MRLFLNKFRVLFCPFWALNRICVAVWGYYFNYNRRDLLVLKVIEPVKLLALLRRRAITCCRPDRYAPMKHKRRRWISCYFMPAIALDSTNSGVQEFIAWGLCY
jgi:hypothetical protein